MALFALAQAQTTASPNCDEVPCPYNYEPVCATPRSGGKRVTFGNDCGARTYACQHSLGEFIAQYFKLSIVEEISNLLQITLSRLANAQSKHNQP